MVHQYLHCFWKSITMDGFFDTISLRCFTTLQSKQILMFVFSLPNWMIPKLMGSIWTELDNHLPGHLHFFEVVVSVGALYQSCGEHAKLTAVWTIPCKNNKVHRFLFERYRSQLKILESKVGYLGWLGKGLILCLLIDVPLLRLPTWCRTDATCPFSKAKVCAILNGKRCYLGKLNSHYLTQ